jgi:type IV pilus assembly protein PilB
VAPLPLQRICSGCREPYEAQESVLAAHGHRSAGKGKAVLYRGRGCQSCRFTGMRGRVAIYELMPTSPEITALIARNGSTNEVRESARQHGLMSLRQAGLVKVVEGVTTLAEVLRVTPDEAAGLPSGDGPPP